AQWAEDHGDEKTADDCYAKLVKTYGGCWTLDELLGVRLGHLRQKNRSQPFFTLARYYLKTYPQGRYGGSIVSWWTQLAQPAILAGEKALQDETTTLVDEFQGAEGLSALRWKLDLAIAGKKFDLAGELGPRMLEDRYWSAGMFDIIRHYGRQAETLKALEAAARKKYGIPDQDPQSKAAAMYKELKGRIQDDQQRHMEQIGREMFSDCRDDYWTIEAVWELVNYYFGKVMPEPRDEWIKRMVSAWPRHPRTQSVLHMWIVADRAANRYDRLAEAIDLYRANFPGGDSYYQDRLSCYDAAKDEEGRLAYVRSYFGPGGARGNVYAIERLANYELAALPEQTSEALGGYWTNLAGKHAGTRAELYCLHRALEYLHHRPHYYKHLGLNVRWDDALAVVKRLQQQKIDPEIAWDVAFLDVTLLAQKPDAAAAVGALNTALGNKRKVRDLALRVNLADLGKALGESKMIQQGVELAERLRKACRTADDLDGINSMLGAMYHYGGAPLVAARHYAAIVDADPWPVRKQGTMMHAMRLLGSNAQLYSGAAEQYVRKIAGAQGVIPEMLFEVGQYHLNRRSGVVMQVLGQLRQQYPASSFRGKLEVMAADAARTDAGGNR
ncbi:MAG TPA: hypothetical protein VM098_02620, partial [Phycisphaerae bacterium]|nr:hypothetical protein [Phycisphaerae bacterium]